jgi:hypothetical protein
VIGYNSSIPIKKLSADSDSARNSDEFSYLEVVISSSGGKDIYS